MTLRALIFDVDGTLAETEEAHRQAFNDTFRAAGLNWVWTVTDYQVLLRTTGGKERMKAYRAAMGHGPSDAEIAELHRSKTQRYTQIVASGGLVLRPGVADLISRAREVGCKLALATTTSQPNVDALCQACWRQPATELFDVIVAGDDVAAKKPAPDIYQLAVRRLGVEADQVLCFEDSPMGMQSAQAAGLRVIVTPSLYFPISEFPRADWVVQSLLTLDWNSEKFLPVDFHPEASHL